MVFYAVGGFVEFSLATQGQSPIIKFQVKVILFHPEKFGANQIRLLAFEDVDG